MASTVSPGARSRVSANCAWAKVSGVGGWTCSTARSESVSVPTRRAGSSRPSAKTTRKLRPFWVTWALVATWPSGVTTVPLPEDTVSTGSPCLKSSRTVRMLTTTGSTLSRAAPMVRASGATTDGDEAGLAETRLGATARQAASRAAAGRVRIIRRSMGFRA